MVTAISSPELFVSALNGLSWHPSSLTVSYPASVDGHLGCSHESIAAPEHLLPEHFASPIPGWQADAGGEALTLRVSSGDFRRSAVPQL
jgi:hypothetical protein